MTEPLKDFRPAIRPQTHRVLARIARSRGITLQELGREILEQYVVAEIHRAKVILGQDDNNAPAAESRGSATEDDGTRRSARPHHG